eukprot:g1892.t1
MLAMQVLADHTPHVFHAGLDLVHILLKDGTTDDHGDDRDDDKPCFSSQSLEAIHVRVALAGLFPVLETRAGTATPVGLKKIFDTVEFICAQQHCGFVSVGYHVGRYNDPTIPWQRLTGRLLLLGHVIDIGGFARDGDLTLEHTMETARTFMQNPNPSIRRAAIELVMTSYRHAGMDVERYLRGLQKNLMETLRNGFIEVEAEKAHPEDRRRIKAKRIYRMSAAGGAYGSNEDFDIDEIMALDGQDADGLGEEFQLQEEKAQAKETARTAIHENASRDSAEESDLEIISDSDDDATPAVHASVKPKTNKSADNSATLSAAKNRGGKHEKKAASKYAYDRDGNHGDESEPAAPAAAAAAAATATDATDATATTTMATPTKPAIDEKDSLQGQADGDQHEKSGKCTIT